MGNAVIAVYNLQHHGIFLVNREIHLRKRQIKAELTEKYK